MARIAIADDHAIVRKGLRQIISETDDLLLAAEAGSAEELLTVLRTGPFDLVVLDVTLGPRSGLELLKQIRSEFPRLRVLMLSMHAESMFAARALRAGASGYIEKQHAPEKLLEAIRRILAGGVYVSEELAAQFTSDIAHGHRERLPHERLTDRELEVFRLLGTGRSVTDIARSLNVSVKTVSTHRTRILEKTGFSDNAEIVRYVATHQLA